MRWIAGRTGIATDKQRHGELDGLVDWPNLVEANGYISRLPIHVDDQPRLAVGQIRQRARRIRRQHGLDLVVIDHLQLMRQGGRQESRRTEIGDITSSLKALAKELGVPILLVSQLNRALENRDDKRPTMADLKESGDIEQDADIIIFVHRDAYYLERAEPKRRPHQTDEAYASETNDWHERCDNARGKADLIVAKNRQGRTGFAVCSFDAKRQRFETLERWER
jgi:replicative DNA helicase